MFVSDSLRCCHCSLAGRPKLYFRYGGEVKAFTDMKKLREFTTRRLALQERVKGVVLPETKKTKGYKIKCKITDRGRKLQPLFRIGC